MTRAFGRLCLIALMLVASAVWAEPDLPDADIYVLGEVHDNPAHHETQAAWVAAINPKAVVYEMLTPEQASRVTPGLAVDPQALAEALDWAASGWPEFEMYTPIFAASQTARVYGAGVPRDVARKSMQAGAAAHFGAQAVRFGLTKPLPELEQSAREALQMRAHCDALPQEMLPAMVEIQRLRDARLAQEALGALDDTGGPVVVITGNGHARKDWGMPALVTQAAPKVVVFSLGQTEDGAALEGSFDRVLSAPAVARPDPCLAFQ